MSEETKTKQSVGTASADGTNQNTVPLNTANAGIGVWLVKVPNYLAKKWNEAPDNSEVGVIRITQSKAFPKPKQEVVFLLNESLKHDKLTDEKIPTEHKFMMTPLGSQDVYILKQSKENNKDSLAIVGKVMQRAECTPVQNDTNYIQLKRESMKKFLEPKKQIQLANEFLQKQHFLPRSNHVQNVEKKDNKVKRPRKDKELVLDLLFNAFNKHQYYSIKALIKITQQPQAYLKDILHEICKYNIKGQHKSTWELKEEYKQGDTTDAKKKAAYESLEKKTAQGGDNAADDYMDEDDDDLSDDDFDDIEDDE